MATTIIFLALALIAVGAALGMLFSRNAVHSALFLILNFSTIAVLYIVLNAPFIAMVQVTVYAGAIMVLFLFVIMLLGAERLAGALGVGATPGVSPQRSRLERLIAAVMGFSLVILFIWVLLAGEERPVRPSQLLLDTSPEALGRLLFSNYALPFEVTSVLLLASMIGIVVWGQWRKGGMGH